jgi:hypothetical protein
LVAKKDKKNTKKCYDRKIISGRTLQKNILRTVLHNLIYQEIWLEILIYVG